MTNLSLTIQAHYMNWIYYETKLKWADIKTTVHNSWQDNKQKGFYYNHPVSILIITYHN